MRVRVNQYRNTPIGVKNTITAHAKYTFLLIYSAYRARSMSKLNEVVTSLWWRHYDDVMFINWDCWLALIFEASVKRLISNNFSCHDHYHNAGWWQMTLVKMLIDRLISSFLSSCHEKATEALCIGRIQTRLGVAIVFEFSVGLLLLTFSICC